MRRTLLIIAGILVITETAVEVRADLPVPFWERKEQERRRLERFLQPIPQMAAVPPPNAWRVVVEVKPGATRPVLVIPRSAMDRVSLREPKSQRQDGPCGSALPVVPLVLAAALTGVGVILLRGRVRLAFAAGLVAMAGITFASNRSRVEAAPPEVRTVRMGNVLIENVLVETPPDGEVRLILPPELLSRFRAEKR